MAVTKILCNVWLGGDRKERNAESAKTDFYVRLDVLLSNAKGEKDAT